MNSRKINLIWGISLIAIGIATIVLIGSNFIASEMNDTVIRICGGIDLVSLPVCAFLTAKKVKNRK